MKIILLIIKREFFNKIRNKSFWVMAFLGPLLLTCFIAASVFIKAASIEHSNVLVVDEGLAYGLYPVQLKNSPHVSFYHQQKVMSDSTFVASDFDLMLYLNKSIVRNNSAILSYKRQPSAATEHYIKRQVENGLEELKVKIDTLINNDHYFGLKQNLNWGLKDAISGKKQTFNEKATWTGFAFATLIYFFIFMYSVQVMRGVIEEKTSRIVEVMISSVKPHQLLFGKIAGIGLSGLLQFFLWCLISGIVLFAFKGVLVEQVAILNPMTGSPYPSYGLADSNYNSDVLNLIFNEINLPLMLGMFAFYFIGGFMLYGAIFAAIGAMVDTETDSQQFIFPVTLPLILAFVVAQITIQDPDNIISNIFSVIPFTSPVVMMVKIPFGIEPLKLLSSALLLLSSILLMTWFAARIYRHGILHYGKRASFKDLFKWIKE